MTVQRTFSCQSFKRCCLLSILRLDSLFVFRSHLNSLFLFSLGAVFFDRNGSRVMPYSIVQMRNNDFVVVAEATSSPELKVSFLQPDSPTKGFYYPGGKLPEDVRICLHVMKQTRFFRDLY